MGGGGAGPFLARSLIYQHARLLETFEHMRYVPKSQLAANISGYSSILVPLDADEVSYQYSLKPIASLATLEWTFISLFVFV